MIMSPRQVEALGDRFATNPVCVGPFRYVSRAAGDRITLAKSTLVLRAEPSRSTRSSSGSSPTRAPAPRTFASGDVQVLDRIASTDLPAIARDRNLRVIKATSIGYQGISFNIGNKNGLGSRTSARRWPRGSSCGRPSSSPSTGA